MSVLVSTGLRKASLSEVKRFVPEIYRKIAFGDQKKGRVPPKNIKPEKFARFWV